MKNCVPATIKIAVNQLISWIGRWVGLSSLTKEQTISYLTPFQHAFHKTNRLHLPEVTDVTDASKVIFTGREAISHPSYVWAFKPEERSAGLLHSGNVLTEGHALCTDFWVENLLKKRFRADKRQHYETDILVAPFSHFQDGYSIGGYYDFSYLIAAKLCRIENAFPDGIFKESVVSYPLFHTDYEQELLTYMGFDPKRILDSRQFNISFKTCLLGNSGHWFYPNEADVKALRQRLLPLIQPRECNQERVYISRNGRRRIVNEEVLIRLLQQYDFRIVEDKPRSLGEQLSIYNGASFVLGPHGASFSNLIWCQPGTHMVELFSSTYAPDFFLYLSQLMGLRYSAYRQIPAEKSPRNPLDDDINVSISEFERGLNALFEQDFRQKSKDM